MKTKLHTENLAGNLHMASNTVNRLGLAKYVIAMEGAGAATVVVFRMPAGLVARLRAETPSQVGDNSDLEADDR